MLTKSAGAFKAQITPLLPNTSRLEIRSTEPGAPRDGVHSGPVMSRQAAGVFGEELVGEAHEMLSKNHFG